MARAATRRLTIRCSEPDSSFGSVDTLIQQSGVPDA